MSVSVFKFWNNWNFLCPTCRHDVLSAESARAYRKCCGCKHLFSAKRMRATCAVKGCDEATVGLCCASEGAWESRCAQHAAEDLVPIVPKHSKRRFKSSNLPEKVISALRGRKERVIRKGEFPGQYQ